MSAPALEAVEYHQVMFSGKFLAPSVYRGEPRPELEQAWKRIANDGLRSIRIPKEDLHRLNKSATKDIVGFGDEQNEDAHDAQGFLEVFHQLHCLVGNHHLPTQLTANHLICRMNYEWRPGQVVIPFFQTQRLLDTILVCLIPITQLCLLTNYKQTIALRCYESKSCVIQTSPQLLPTGFHGAVIRTRTLALYIHAGILTRCSTMFLLTRKIQEQSICTHIEIGV
jgi:hypothetical protein